MVGGGEGDGACSGVVGGGVGDGEDSPSTLREEKVGNSALMYCLLYAFCLSF